MSLNYPGGFITKSPTAPTSTSAPGIWTMDQALQYIKAGTWPTPPYGEPYFNYVSLLTGTGGTNGAQNNTFLDSSSNNFTITRNGNTTQGTFTPFSQAAGYWSNYFDGTTDQVQYGAASNWKFLSDGTSDWTIEFWANVSGTNTQVFLDTSNVNGNNAGISILFNESGQVGKVSVMVFPTSGGSNYDLISSSNLPTNQWVHIASTYSATTKLRKIYFNGVLSGTLDTTGFTYSSANPNRALSIGWSVASYSPVGYMSNVRVTNAIIYTSNFTPSTTPLSTTVSSGTVQLLTAQSNRFIDNSTNAYTATASGEVAVIPVTPFLVPTSQYSATVNGGSGYFDGSGDYLSVADQAAFTLGSGNFTVEAWVYPTTTGVQRIISGQSNSSATGSSISYWFDMDSSNQPRILIWSGGTDYTATSSVAVAANQWVHLAGVRDGNTLSIYVNGVQRGTVSVTGVTVNNSSNELAIGRLGEHTNVPWTGYISGFRFVVGTAVYTGSSFTIPTAPPTAITNTQLLTNFTNAGIFDYASDNDLETVGNAQVNTSVTKFGNSMYFDGSGDYLISQAPSSNYAFGTGEFTIEFWLYLNSVASVQSIYDSRPSATDGAYPTIYMDGDTIKYYVSSNDRITGVVLSTSTWYHIAVSRSSASTKMFVNGNQVGATYSDSTNYLNPASRPFIGSFSSSPSFYLNGYLSNLRVTRGVGRYTYNFTPPTRAFGTFYQAEAAPAADPYFDYTTLLLPGNGTNGAQNNTFLDSSTNAFSITRNGNTTQGTFSPFSQTGWSNYFDGTGDYLSTADSISLGSGDFTVGCWVYLNATGAEMPVVCSPNYYRSGYNGNFVMRVGTSNLYNSFDGQSSGAGISGTYSWQTNTWFYVAWVRSGSTITVYRNGMSLGTVSSSRDLSDSANGLYIAVNRINNAIQSDNLNGYISNLRILVGTADTAVPTAPFTAITNTKLLTCQSNRFVDENTQVAAKTITVNGDTSVQAFSPFNPTAAYSAATNGGSGYFDGTGDYLETSSSSNQWAFGTGDFTVECWLYTNAATNRVIMANRSGSTGLTTHWSLEFFNTAKRVEWHTGVAIIASSNTDVQLNAWVHIAVVRNSGTLKIYQNGVEVASASDANNYSSVNPLLIANEPVFPSGNSPFLGYIASIRIVKGTAVYTTGFTPPTAPLTAITNTSLLCNFTNAGIIDQTGKNVLETVGNAQISTTQSKFGGSSMYFDGTGDGLKQPTSQNSNWYFGSGDMTIECWAYFNSVTGYQTLVDFRTTGGGGFSSSSFVLWVDAGTLSFYAGAYNTASPLLSGGSISTGQWYHIAVSRYGGTTKLFLNGNQTATTTNAWAQTVSSTDILSIGATTDVSSNYLNGYIDDLRITKGIARYTQNFTPPTAAFQLL